MVAAPLSHRARALLARVRKGEYYLTYSDRTPAAMRELLDAGLVREAGRVERVVSAYVPAAGYVPFTPEKFLKDDD